MTPKQLAKSGSEHGNQVALFAYCAVARLHGWNVADDWAAGMGFDAAKSGRTNDQPVPALEWLHAIHNQGHGDAVRGARAKAEGVRRGIADLFLPWPLVCETAAYHGLYIEMKKPSEAPKRVGSKGGVSKEQVKFGEYVKSVGYGFAVCYGWEHAVATLRSYIEYKE